MLKIMLLALDWDTIIPLVASAVAPAIASVVFMLVQRAMAWIQKLPDLAKTGLYVLTTALIAVVQGLVADQLPGDLSQFDPKTWESVILALFYAFIYRKGRAGATTAETSTVARR